MILNLISKIKLKDYDNGYVESVIQSIFESTTKKNPATYINSNKKIKKKLLEFIKEAKNLPCMDCGIKYPYYVMDFDHRDSKSKKFSISQYNQIGSIEKIKNEIAKCDVICANCHRERTFGRITIMDDGTVF